MIPYRLAVGSGIKLLDITNPDGFESVSYRKLRIKKKILISPNYLSQFKDF